VRRVIILHGRPDEDEYLSDAEPSASNGHWIPWTQKQLLIAGYDVQTPEIFRSFEMSYQVWLQEFERSTTTAPMVLVGHSCGAGFLVRWLSEHPAVAVDKLVLVAPWLDPERSVRTDFFAFEIDDRLMDRVGELHIFVSSDDPYKESILDTVHMLNEHYPAAIQHRYDNMGHFCFEQMHTEHFPDLVAAIVG